MELQAAQKKTMKVGRPKAKVKTSMYGEQGVKGSGSGYHSLEPSGKQDEIS